MASTMLHEKCCNTVLQIEAPSPMVVTLGQQYNVAYNVGEKPTVILYTYINRHAGPSNITTSVKGWHTGRLWSMTLSASLRTVILCFSLLLPFYKNP